ncbi:MAG: alpha/beta fold hydrolase [Bacteroidales bacterium]
MANIQLKDTPLEYIEKGRGEPLILVHGTLGDYRTWQLQMQAFAAKYRTISYSRRYHHPNPCSGNETDYSAYLHADDLAGFISGLGLDSAHIVGTSYGAYTALLLAARHPEKARTLVLGDPPVFPLMDNNPEGRSLTGKFLDNVWNPAGKMIQQGKIEEGVKTFVNGVVEPGTFENFPVEVQQMIMQNACEFKVETASPDFWTHFTCEDAKKVKTPALLLTGDRSLRMFQLIVGELERCLPDNESFLVPETTHEVISDNPEAYNRIVLDFLGRHGP